MKNVDIEELNANEVLLDSMLFRMIQISENAKKLSDEYKLHRGNVPWNAIYGLRNRIVHDYGNVDLNVDFETLKPDIPELLEIIYLHTPMITLLERRLNNCENLERL